MNPCAISRKSRTMNELKVTMRQYSKLKKLADDCTEWNQNGHRRFAEDRWLAGVKEILGYLPPLYQEYKVVVVDEMIVKIGESK